MSTSSDPSVYEGKTVLVTGSHGFLGRHVVRELTNAGAVVLPFIDDLRQPVAEGMYGNPDLIIHLAAKIAGIAENNAKPLDFLAANTRMALNIIDYAANRAIPIVAAGSVCAYPEYAETPFYEAKMFDGRPEASNFGYGIAKRLLVAALESAGRQMDLPYVCLVSANLYGVGDHFGPRAHVIPNLVEKFSVATRDHLESVEIWGSGKPTRDFLNVRDAARAYLLAGSHLLHDGKSLLCNIGSGEEVSITVIASMIAEIYGYEGKLTYNHSKPDGQLRRRVNTVIAKHALGWEAHIPLRVGLTEFIMNFEASKVRA